MPYSPKEYTITAEAIQQRYADLLQKKKRLLQPGANNVKLAKNSIDTWILNLLPYKQNSMQKNLCPFSTQGCQAACLSTSGKSGLDSVQYTRGLNTEVFLAHKYDFLWLLHLELKGIQIQAQIDQKRAAVRLNGTTDLDWLKMLWDLTAEDPLIQFDQITFYDYTKDFKKWKRYQGTGYYQTFSESETNWDQCQDVLVRGGSVASVFQGTLPDCHRGYPVVNGDLSDERWLDLPGHIVGLRYKPVSGANMLNNGFITKHL